MLFFIRLCFYKATAFARSWQIDQNRSVTPGYTCLKLLVKMISGHNETRLLKVYMANSLAVVF